MLLVLLSSMKCVNFTLTFGILFANDLPMEQEYLLNASEISLSPVINLSCMLSTTVLIFLIFMIFFFDA